MSEEQHKELGKVLWSIADRLRGAMNADDFRDYMLSFLFLRYLSDKYEEVAKLELGDDYPPDSVAGAPLQHWYENNAGDVAEFEGAMRRRAHYTIEPRYLWSAIAHMAARQDKALIRTLQNGFRHIEEESFTSAFEGLFSEVNLNSDKLGKNDAERNERLCKIISEIAGKLNKFSTSSDALGNAYEYLIGQFAAVSGKKAGEFYTPQQISTILSRIVALDGQDPTTGAKERIECVLDFACGSGSLLLNVRRQFQQHGIDALYGQESNITTYNLARMNMLLHEVQDSEFHIFHGDTLKNDWPLLNEGNPAKKMYFDAVVANPPFSLRWDPKSDVRFKNYGVAPKSASDFAFLLHGFHHLKPDGVMAIILPHGVLFRGGVEKRIRTKLLDEEAIDTVIGLPANLFYSTGIPVCIVVLKKCKKPDDVLFINASEQFEKGKRQNQLRDADIDKIVSTYQFRTEEARYSRCVSMQEIKKNDYNLNISRYVSTAEPEKDIDLQKVHDNLAGIAQNIAATAEKHNQFLRELGLPALP